MADLDLQSFCRTEYPRIVGILTLYCGDRAVAEELAQEALARAWARWAKVSRLDNPSAWLYRVAINLARSLLRRRRAERRAHERLRNSSGGAQVDPPSASDIAVRTAVAELGDRQKTVIVLHYFVGLPLPQIAELLDLPLATVKSHARRGREKLRHLLEDPTGREVPHVV